MHGGACHLRPHLIAALVTGDDPHFSRLSDDDDLRARSVLRHPIQKDGHAIAADFLVKRKCDVDRTGQVRGLESGNRGKDTGQKPLHIHRAATIEAVAFAGQRERVSAPGLPFDRHNIHVAIQDDAALYIRPDGGEDIGALSRSFMA